MNILVTGGAGFLGSHLCDVLISQGHFVICVDNFVTGSRDNVAHLLDDPQFELIEHDIIEPLQTDHNIDQIYNLASPASPPRYQERAIFTIKTNTIGTLNMLELAQKKGARFFQASTSEIYGDPLEHPQKETYRGNVNSIGPRACYDEGKRVAETLCFDFERKFGTEIRVVRIFNTYGPRMAPDDGRVVSNFIMQAINGEDITIYGDGTHTRSFCFVSDLIEGFVRTMNAENFTGPVNLGNPTEFTIAQLADKVVALTQSNSQIVHHDLPEDDPTRRQPNIDLAKEKLGWEPVVHLDDGLKKTIAYFQKKNAKA